MSKINLTDWCYNYGIFLKNIQVDYHDPHQQVTLTLEGYAPYFSTDNEGNIWIEEPGVSEKKTIKRKFMEEEE